MRPINPGEVLVLDLDGTLLPYNSFHKWLAFLLREGIPGARLLGRITVAVAILSRVTGRSNHAEMKLAVMKAWRSLPQDERNAKAQIGRFSRQLIEDFRPELLKLIAAAQARGVPCLLATAAPEDYAAELDETGLFDCVLASHIEPDGALVETRHDCKLEAVMAEIADRGWAGRPIVLATDHHDDGPLCAAACFTYWYGPTEAWDDLSNENREAITGEPRIVS